MKWMGIDYGTKNIGIALSDDTGRIAFPKMIIQNDGFTFDKILNLLEEEQVGSVVIGDSVNSKGEKNIVSEKIDFFVSELKDKCALPLYREKEFFTSMEAAGRKGKEIRTARKIKTERKKKNDASAAALILQRYLDKINK